MIALLMLPLLFGNFVLKWYIPRGIDWGAGKIITGDTDRDGNYEFIFSTYGGSYTIYLYELHLPDIWEIDSVSGLDQPLLWDTGDFDLDGFYDLVMQSSWGAPLIGITIFESPDSFSYPKEEVWRDTVGFALVQPISVFDLDRDSLPELVNNNGNGQPHYVWIYETIGDNQYDTVYTFNPIVDTFELGIASNHAFGDFDGDNRVEFVAGELSGYYWVFESPSNNTYEQVHQGLLSTGNIKDCFTVPDADGDGKLEFVVKGFVVPTGRINAFIFEATGDNSYEIVQSFDLYGGHYSYYGGYSDAGDVDGDGVAEIVLEGCENVHVIKAAGNDSFYVWQTLSGNWSGSSVRVYDVDGNGLSEVIISGNNRTRIYEYQVGIAEASVDEVQRIGLSVSPNPFCGQTMIEYSIEDAGHWGQDQTLRVYDATGRLVRDFSVASRVKDHRSALTWYGDDNVGRRLPGGVYFVEFMAADDSVTEKLLLIR